MPRFLLQPKWLAFHLLVIVAVVGMVFAGFWQLRRLDERRADNALIAQRLDQPPVSIESLLADPDTDIASIENRLVIIDGTYLPDQVVVFNKTQNGRAVDFVLTASVLGDGTTIIVNRGGIPVSSSVPAPPQVAVETIGRVRPTEQRQRGQLSDAPTNDLTEVRRVDLELLETKYGHLAPVYVELLSSTPAATPTDPDPLALPILDEKNHLSYAGQWFIFSACVPIGWVLAVRRSIKTAAQGGQTPADSPSPDDVGSTTALP